MMNIFENPVLARGLAIAAGGVVVGLLLSFGRGIVRLVWKYKQEAATVPVEEILPAMALAVTPITKAFYAIIVATVLLQRNFTSGELSIVSTFACGAFALVAVVQGAVAAKLINTPTAKDGLIGSFQFKMAILGGIETLAIFALVGTIVFSARFST
jgi:hypothetical protein